MTTLEEVRRCPKCEQPGRDVTKSPQRDGSTVYTVECANKRCRWADQRWVYQVRADGSLVEAQKHHRKNYPALPGDGSAFLSALDREINNSMHRN